MEIGCSERLRAPEITMKPILFLLLIFALAMNVWTQNERNEPSPQEQKLSEELAADREYNQVGCAGYLKTANAEKSANYRRAAFEIFATGKLKKKLKRSCGTREGDPIVTYLAVENGTAIIYVDWTRDRFGPGRLFSYTCSNLDFGSYSVDQDGRAMVFQKKGAGKIKSEEVALRCVANAKEIVF